MRTGNARWLTEIFSQFGIAMGIGVLSIYAVLVMHIPQVHPAGHDSDRAAAVGWRRARRAAG